MKQPDNPLEAIFGGTNQTFTDMINKMIFDMAIKPQVELEMKRLKEIADDLNTNGNFVVVQIQKDKQKVVHRGTQTSCMDVWMKLYEGIQLKRSTKRYIVQEIETVNPDKSLVYGKIIIE